jgi:hypothetical protein
MFGCADNLFVWHAYNASFAVATVPTAGYSSQTRQQYCVTGFKGYRRRLGRVGLPRDAPTVEGQRHLNHNARCSLHESLPECSSGGCLSVLRLQHALLVVDTS